MRTLIALALAAGLSSHAWAAGDGTEPDPVLTPGEVRTVEKAEICGHRTGEFRHVTVTEKVASRRAYGIAGEFAGYCGNADANGKRGCEQDHRVPLTVGGGNSPGSIRNIWPQRPDGPFGYHVKDRCEEAVGRDICSGKITVGQAQAVFLGDWRVNCRPWVPELPNVE